MLSIVMPVWTGYQVTYRAVQAITACTGIPYEVIIVDNGSDPECKAVIADFEHRRRNIRVIRNEGNRGYPVACNQGLRASCGQYAAVMNNDVLVTPGWAERMIAAFSAGSRIGIVGPRTNYVFGDQLVTDCHYDEAALDDWSREWQALHSGSLLFTDRLVGFLMMIRREVIEQIGGFDPVFGPGNFEDDDYCLRARLAGYRLAIAGDVFVHHYGSLSFNRLPAAFSMLLETNRRLFAAKWGLEEDCAGKQTILEESARGKLYISLG